MPPVVTISDEPIMSAPSTVPLRVLRLVAAEPVWDGRQEAKETQAARKVGSRSLHSVRPMWLRLQPRTRRLLLPSNGLSLEIIGACRGG